MRGGECTVSRLGRSGRGRFESRKRVSSVMCGGEKLRITYPEMKLHEAAFFQYETLSVNYKMSGNFFSLLPFNILVSHGKPKGKILEE